MINAASCNSWHVRFGGIQLAKGQAIQFGGIQLAIVQELRTDAQLNLDSTLGFLDVPLT